MNTRYKSISLQRTTRTDNNLRDIFHAPFNNFLVHPTNFALYLKAQIHHPSAPFICIFRTFVPLILLLRETLILSWCVLNMWLLPIHDFSSASLFSDAAMSNIMSSTLSFYFLNYAQYRCHHTNCQSIYLLILNILFI